MKAGYGGAAGNAGEVHGRKTTLLMGVDNERLENAMGIIECMQEPQAGSYIANTNGRCSSMYVPYR